MHVTAGGGRTCRTSCERAAIPARVKAASIVLRRTPWHARRRRISGWSASSRVVSDWPAAFTCSCSSGGCEMWKDWIRPFVRPLPQWSPVAVAPPQTLVTAALHWDGETADVTTDHTVASLKPLTIATSVDAGSAPTLEYRDRATGRLLGILRLARAATVAAPQAPLVLYHVTAGEHYCLGWPRRDRKSVV